MKRSRCLGCIVVIVLALALIRWRASQVRKPLPPEPVTVLPGAQYRVLRVVDGDTVRVFCQGQDTAVRLLRMDTPERGEAGYDGATAALAELLKGGSVRLEFETPGKVERDRFDRLLCYVYLPDGRCADVEMVRLGWSKSWTRSGQPL